MTIYNLGSINIDHIYRLNHLPRPGETLKSCSYDLGLGGKGANQSLAAARAGGKVVHLGAISATDNWVIDQLQTAGINTDHITRLTQTATGHAIIMVDERGENSIILHGGANLAITESQIAAGLSRIRTDDILLLQNETTQQISAAVTAREAGAKVIYSAAPFSLTAVRQMLPYVSVLALNEVESQQLFAALSDDLPVDGLLITLGSRGAQYRDQTTGRIWYQPAFSVTPTDTTGAGDCFAGWFAAGLERGEDIATALHHAAAAAALQVTQAGAGPAMPNQGAVMRFIASAQQTSGADLSARLHDPMSEV